MFRVWRSRLLEVVGVMETPSAVTYMTTNRNPIDNQCKLVMEKLIMLTVEASFVVIKSNIFGMGWALNNYVGVRMYLLE